MNVIEVDHLQVSIEQKSILHQINLVVKQGDVIGLIGPNGSGKSTLLKTIANLQKITSGKILVDNQDIRTYRQKELAKKLSYVPQDTSIDFDFKAKEIVWMGRHIHSSRFQTTMEDDFLSVKNAMIQTNTWHLAERSILSLSGGQRQLVLIAKSLAQETPILLLDEPISALDIYFQLHVLTMLQCVAYQGKTIIVVLHDLNLASRYCTKLLLLEKGEVKKFGNSDTVLKESILKQTYHVNTQVRLDEVTNSITVTPLNKYVEG